MPFSLYLGQFVNPNGISREVNHIGQTRHINAKGVALKNKSGHIATWKVLTGCSSNAKRLASDVNGDGLPWVKAKNTGAWLEVMRAIRCCEYTTTIE
jgi:hypothetical protein